MDRYIELNAIRQMRTLTREEAKEFETLFNSREAAKQDAQVLAARAENERLQRQLEANAQNRAVAERWRQLFNTVIDGLQPMDTTANREVIKSWVNPGETFTDARAWFKQVLQDSPQLAKQISWKKYLTLEEQKKQREKEAQELREEFARACRGQNISECTSNWMLWSQIENPIISELAGRPVVLDQDGNAMDLVPATELERANWGNERFDQHQADLRRMRKENDIQGLRAAAHRERAEHFQNSAILRRDRELAAQYKKDIQAGYTEPLPQVFDKKTIYGWDAKIMREKISRYGASRITARIYALTEIENPDKPGEIIRFEE